MMSTPKRTKRFTRIVQLVLAVAWSAGCSLDGLLKNDDVPPGLQDPAATETPTGAMQVYLGALEQFSLAFSNGGQGASGEGVVESGGRLSDELGGGDFLGSLTQNPNDIDRRNVLDDNGTSKRVFSKLQQVRGQANQAIGLLTRHFPGQPSLAGHLYALQGYAELFLAELYCSGIPLSTLDFDGDYTLKPGSSTPEVFAHAAALFDTALVLGGDNMDFVHLAVVGKGRALLGIGDYAAAAAAVAAVPDAYRYEVRYKGGSENKNLGSGFVAAYSVSEREGVNGLDYISSGDPRTAVTFVQTNGAGYSLYRPVKYDNTGVSPIVLASGVEARLIGAEGALQAGSGTWLTMLNALRTDGTFEVDTQVIAVDNSVTPPDTTFAYDTLWHAGGGGTAGLAPLADPGTAEGRVELLFRERAFWLFLTGHRQGDLRRLIRQYGRFQDKVYPVGAYPPDFEYGKDVTFPIPPEEKASNLLFTGCISRSA